MEEKIPRVIRTVTNLLYPSCLKALSPLLLPPSSKNFFTQSRIYVFLQGLSEQLEWLAVP